MIQNRGWVQQAIRDESDLVDVAYVSLYGIMLATVGTIPILCLISFVSWLRCNCAFDPEPLGIAVGAVCGGFAMALGALGIYMATTRTQHNREQTVVAPNATTVTQNQPQAAEAATDVEPTKRRR